MAIALPAFAEQTSEKENIWQQPEPQKRLSPELIDDTLDRMEKENPEKADQLRQLREEDPEKFRDEIRQMVREHVKNRRHKNADMRDENGFKPPRRDNRQPGQRRGRIRERMQEEKELFSQWLTENYPQRAIELEKLEDQNPRLYRSELMDTMRQYGQLYRAEKDNPELAEVLKKDMTLKKEVDELVDLINDTDSEDEKQQLTDQLNDVLSQRFDLIVLRKQLQIAEMQERLAELQKRVNEKQIEINNLKTQKQKEVDARAKELLETDKRIDWN